MSCSFSSPPRHRLEKDVDFLKRGYEEQGRVIERLMDLNNELADTLNAK